MADWIAYAVRLLTEEISVDIEGMFAKYHIQRTGRLEVLKQTYRQLTGLFITCRPSL